MIRYFYATSGHLKSSTVRQHDPANKLVWIDLFTPEPEEMTRIDSEFNLDLPTQDEMREIEISSRLYEEDGAQYMTMTYLSNALGDQPEITQLTFILKDDLLLTMRYREMRIINHFIEKAENKGLGGIKSGRDLLLYILENFIDLCADVLEKNHGAVEELSRRIFDQSKKKQDYQQSLKAIASIGDLNSKVRETLVSLNRTITFWGGSLEGARGLKEPLMKLRTLATDVTSLLDHAAFVSGKVMFLLDATLGLVNLEQNAIIKIFSVAAVIFLPPTLVASIYGMNFKFIPELEWVYGYPMALLLMLISAVLPYVYFKYKNWL